VHLRFS